MAGFMIHKKIGLILSIAACAIVVGTQAKSLTQQSDDQGSSADLGLESAWPHLRVDFTR